MCQWIYVEGVLRDSRSIVLKLNANESQDKIFQNKYNKSYYFLNNTQAFFIYFIPLCDVSKVKRSIYDCYNIYREHNNTVG